MTPAPHAIAVGAARGKASDLVAVGLLAGAVIAAGAGRPAAAAVCAALALLLGLSRLWAQLVLKDVRYRFAPTSDRAVAGDTLDIDLEIENRKPLPVPWLEVDEHLPEGFEPATPEATERTLWGAMRLHERVTLGAYERTVVRTTVRVERRGYYRLGRPVIVSGDLFGFYRVGGARSTPASEVVVYPRCLPLPGLRLPAARPGGDARSRSGLLADPTRPVGLRDYRPGDAARTIDWRATARHGKPFVRTYEPSVAQHVVVFAECFTAEPGRGSSGAVLEAVLSAAGSVLLHAATAGYDVGLITNGASPGRGGRPVTLPGRGQAHMRDMMSVLAGAHASPMHALETLAERSALPAGATVVHVTGAQRETTLAYMRGLGRRGHAVVTAWVGSDDPPPVYGPGLSDWRPLFATVASESAAP